MPARIAAPFRLLSPASAAERRRLADVLRRGTVGGALLVLAYLRCNTPGCTFEGPNRHGGSDDDLPEEAGWNIDREFGLHYCPLTTMHDCDVCAAPTRNAIRDVQTGGVPYFCGEHFPRGADL